MDVLGQRLSGYLFIAFFIYFPIVLTMKGLNVQVPFYRNVTIVFSMYFTRFWRYLDRYLSRNKLKDLPHGIFSNYTQLEFL